MKSSKAQFWLGFTGITNNVSLTMHALPDATGEHTPALSLLTPELPSWSRDGHLGDPLNQTPPRHLQICTLHPRTPGQGQPVPQELKPTLVCTSLVPFQGHRAAYRNISWGFSRLSCPELWTKLCPCRCSPNGRVSGTMSLAVLAKLHCALFLKPLLSRSCFTHCPTTNTSTASA